MFLAGLCFGFVGCWFFFRWFFFLFVCGLGGCFLVFVGFGGLVFCVRLFGMGGFLCVLPFTPQA